MQNTFDLQEINGKFTLSVNGIYYNINELTYFILDGIKRELSLSNLAKDVENKFGVTASQDDIAYILENQINPLFEKQHKLQSENSGSFWLKKELLSFEQYQKIVTPFIFLFNPALFWVLFFPVLGLNLYGLFNIPRPAIGIATCESSLLLNLSIYASLFVVILIHELGHAASALNFNVKSKTIGFGFYSIFPVFFADITGIWPLSKNNRMIVNLSGIYIQAILGIFIFLIYLYARTHSGGTFFINFLYYLLAANALTTLINLFPFFKFDGYWCYSDLFNQPNLGKRSKLLVFSIIRKVIPLTFRLDENELRETNLKSIPLIVYTFFKGLTNILLIVFIGSILINFLESLKQINTFSFSSLSWCSAKSWFSYGLITFIFTRLTYKYSKVLFLATKKYFQ